MRGGMYVGVGLRGGRGGTTAWEWGLHGGGYVGVGNTWGIRGQWGYVGVGVTWGYVERGYVGGVVYGGGVVYVGNVGERK